MDIATFYAGFDQRVREIVAFGYEHSPAFRRRMEEAGLTPADIQTTADLSRLPILRKEQLVELQRQGPQLGGMLTVPLARLRRIFQSPGRSTILNPMSQIRGDGRRPFGQPVLAPTMW